MKRTSIVIRTIYVIPSLFFKAILLTLPILIVLQDVSYALSPTSQFKPITDEKQLSQPSPAPSQAETVFPSAPDVLKLQKEPDSDLRKNQGTKPIVRMNDQIRPRILIVEDKEVWREKYKELLSKWGYEPEFAEYGRKAVKIFRENPAGFALVISDLDLNEELPEGVKDIPGEEVISEIRKIHAKIPIIVISARNYTGDSELINHDPILKSRFEAKPEILLEVLEECFHILPATNEPPKDKPEGEKGDGSNLSLAALLIKKVSKEDGAVLISLPRLGRAGLKGKIPGDSEKESRDKEGWVKKLYLRWSIKRSLDKLDKEDNAFSRKCLVEGLGEKLKRIDPQDELFQSAVDKVIEMAMLDNNPNVRKSAAVALGESGAKDAGRLLAVILREDSDPAVKYAAVEALEGIGKTDSETSKVLFETFWEILSNNLGKAYDSTSIDTRLIDLRIILVLSRLPLTDEHKCKLDKLLRDIIQAEKTKQKWYYLPMAKVAIIALSRIHQLNPAVNMLEKKLKEEHLSFHPPFAITGRIDEIGLNIYNAIEEIQSEPSRKAAEALCRGLDQLDVNPREAEKIFTEAIKAWFENKRAKKLIRESSVPTALASIAEALGFIGKSEEAVRALTILAAWDSGYYSIGGKAVEALGRIGAKSVVGKLKRLMNETGISSRIIFAWGRIASPRAVGFLTEIIKRNGWLPCMKYFEEWKEAKESGYTYKEAWGALSLTGRSPRLEIVAQKIQDHDRDWLSQFIAASIHNLRRDRGQILNQQAARGLIFLWQSVVKSRFPDSKKKEDYALYSQLIYGLELGRLILGEKFYSFLSEAGVEKKDFLKPSVNWPVSRVDGGITVNLYGLLSSKLTQDDAVLRREFARRLGIPQEVNVRLEKEGQPIGSWQKAALSTGNYQIPILAYLPALAPSENKDISLLGVSLELDQIFFLLSPGDGYKVVLGLCARGKEFLHGTEEIIKALEQMVSKELSIKNIIVNEEEVLLWLSKLLTRLKELRVVKEDARSDEGGKPAYSNRSYLVDENDKRIWKELPPSGQGKMPRLGKILTIGSGKIKIYFEGIIWESVEKVKDIPGDLINLFTLRQFKENLSGIALVHIEDTWRGIEGYQDIFNKYIMSFKEAFNSINTIRYQGKSYKGIIVENIYDALILLAEELGPLESIQIYRGLKEAGISVLVNGKPLANPLKEGCFSGKFKAGDEITLTPEITSASPEENFWEKIKREDGYAHSFIDPIQGIFVKRKNGDGPDLSAADSLIKNVSKEDGIVPASPAAPAHVETMKLAIELKDIKKSLTEKLFAMEEARDALVKILDEIIKEGLFPGGFVEGGRITQIKKLHSKLTSTNNPEDQKAIIDGVNFTIGAVRRIISEMQNKVKDDEMKDILGMQRRYDEIRNELVKENRGLVWMVVKGYLRKLGKEWEDSEDLSDDLFQNDLFQIGNMYLISAIEGFDPNRGFEFSTYAVPAIERGIQRMLRQGLSEIPEYLRKEKSEIDNFIAKFTQTEKREPTVEEVAAGLKLPVSRIEEISIAFKKPVSLENLFGEEGEEYQHLGLEHPSNREIEPPPENAIIIKEELEQALRGLNEREREVIKLRYWLDYTLEAVGKLLNISRERVRQIERIALNKLRFYLRPKGDSPPSHKREKGDDPDLSPAASTFSLVVSESEKRLQGFYPAVKKIIEELVKEFGNDLRGLNMIELGIVGNGLSAKDRTPLEWLQGKGVNIHGVGIDASNGPNIHRAPYHEYLKALPNDSQDAIFSHLSLYLRFNRRTVDTTDPASKDLYGNPNPFPQIVRVLKPGGLLILVVIDSKMDIDEKAQLPNDEELAMLGMEKVRQYNTDSDHDTGMRLITVLRKKENAVLTTLVVPVPAASLTGNAPTKAPIPLVEGISSGKEVFGASLKSVGAEDDRDLKPFFKKHELGFQNRVTVTVAAGELNGLIIDKNAREGAIYAKIGKLNKAFPKGEIEIEKKIETGVFQCSRKEYKYAVFHFKKEDKIINVLFLEDRAALTSDELAELGIQDIEKRRLDYPGLEGVWFINPDAAKAKSTAEFEKLPSRDALEKEIDRIHNENFKYMPTVPEKTILCHIIADSILPAGQRKMLKILEQNMRDKKYTEKVVSLSVNDPNKFIDELRALMAGQRELYKDYAVNFDVACPNTDLVASILGTNLGIKALAFEPCKEADVAQVEGIILALRALNSGNIETLWEAFKILAGKELPQDLSVIADIDEFIKRITFVLPAAKVIDYSHMIRLNEIIREKIEKAA